MSLPLFLGGFVLFWVYRDFDFAKAEDVLLHGTRWDWMIYSLFFGVLSNVLRGWRWKQVLEPLGANPSNRDCIDAVCISYATNLIIPRIGDVSRCGVLKKYDNIPFAQSFGTVVTERMVDSICIAFITALAFFTQMPVCLSFFRETGTKFSSLGHLFTTEWFYVILLCIVGAGYICYRMIRALSLYDKVKGLLLGVWEGILSLRGVKNMPLFVFYTIAIWASYYLHFYLTFFCFDFTRDLGSLAALLMFAAGTFAVVVPTPNGAGPWHFAVITMMMLYGVSATNAGIFALIVHGIQTFLVVLLGIYGWMSLTLASRKKE